MEFEKGIDELVKDAEQLFTEGRYGESGKLFKEIVENTGDGKHLSTAYLHFGMLVGMKGDTDGEIYYYDAALDKNPLNSYAYEALAGVYIELGDNAKADALYERANEINQMRAKSWGESQK